MAAANGALIQVSVTPLTATQPSHNYLRIRPRTSQKSVPTRNYLQPEVSHNGDRRRMQKISSRERISVRRVQIMGCRDQHYPSIPCQFAGSLHPRPARVLIHQRGQQCARTQPVRQPLVQVDAA
jgi:hypothetical protein